MPDFSGFEPQIGEIRALRTFRVGPGGVLYPLFDNRPWAPGANEAACKVARSVFEPGHSCPDPDCTCGFYAYADERGAAEYPHARYVLAVIACWGRVVAGTRGLRAQFARVEALWLSPTVPADLARAVTEHYPGVAIYGRRADLLAAHPPTRLDSYDDPEPGPQQLRRRAIRTGIVAAVAFGVLPMRWISALPFGWVIWGTLLALVAAVLLRPNKRHDVAGARRRMLAFALVLWLLAPLVGSLGWVVLRVPLAQIGALHIAHRRAMNRIARTFPARIV